MKKIISYAFLAVFLCLSGCGKYYGDYYRLDAQYLARRQMETRCFETRDEEALLIASAQVLQDLGFTLHESETRLGLITASKDREAGSYGQKLGMMFLAALVGTQAIYDTNQKIYVTLVSTPSHNGKGYNVRVEFARIIWNNVNQTRIQRIQDEKIYKDFFDKLSQSVFLTANSI